jgi:hypothetical protein
MRAARLAFVLRYKAPSEVSAKGDGCATELETASSCMPEIESKGRGWRNFESRAKNKLFEERRRNQKDERVAFAEF